MASFVTRGGCSFRINKSRERTNKQIRGLGSPRKYGVLTCDVLCGCPQDRPTQKKGLKESLTLK